MLNSLIIVLLAYSLSKLGYMVLFNNFFQLMALKGKKIEEKWLDKFIKIIGYTLVISGLITASLLLLKKYFPENYLSFYGVYLVLALFFLVYKYFALRRKAAQDFV